MGISMNTSGAVPDTLTVGGGSSSLHAPKGLGLGRCRHGNGGTTYVVEYHRVDKQDEGGGGALVASRKKRVLAWQGRRRALKKRMARWLRTAAQVAVELHRCGGRRRRVCGWDDSDG